MRANGSNARNRPLHLPAPAIGEYLCLSDYFAPVGSGRIDVVALQVVTVGRAASEKFDRAAGGRQLQRGLLLPRAGRADRRSDRQLRPPAHRGQAWASRPGRANATSWGYPACPELDEHALVLRLLPAAAETLGLTLSPAFQWIPEESTAAIIVHHPDAKYFSVGVDRVAQIEGS